MSRPRAPRDDDLLVDVAWLVAALAEPPPPSVLDVRWRLAGPAGVTDFDGGHIPGASYVDLETELAGPVRGDRVGGRHPLPAPEVFEAAMRRAGVRSGRTVVVVDDGDGPAAARAWWCLTYFGHSDVRILEGGWRAWVAAQGEVSSEVSGVEWGDFLAAPGGLAVLDALGTAEFLRRGGALLDARSGERFRGEVEPIDPVAGHVPGARSMPVSELVDAEGCWATPAGVLDLLAAREVDVSSPIGVSCGSGVTAAVVAAALARAGVESALYVGSWSDWLSDPRRPVATGP